MPLTADGKQNFSLLIAALGTNLSLHTAQPSQGTPNEVSGGGYARVAISNAAISNGVISIGDNDVTLPANTTVSYVGIWSATSGGNLISYYSITSPESCAQAGKFRVKASTLVTVTTS